MSRTPLPRTRSGKMGLVHDPVKIEFPVRVLCLDPELVQFRIQSPHSNQSPTSCFHQGRVNGRFAPSKPTDNGLDISRLFNGVGFHKPRHNLSRSDCDRAIGRFDILRRLTEDNALRRIARPCGPSAPSNSAAQSAASSFSNGPAPHAPMSPDYGGATTAGPTRYCTWRHSTRARQATTARQEIQERRTGPPWKRTA